MPVVTGANGFLGSYIVSSLLKRGELVKALKRKDSVLDEFNTICSVQLGDAKDELMKNLSWVEGDLTDIISLDAAFVGEEYVFHCAAKVAFKGNHRELHQVNAVGTANVVNACIKAGVKKLCYVSSTAALGRTDDEKTIDEETYWVDDDNNTAYAVSKHDAELEVWRGVEEGLDAVIVNPGIILGEGDWNKGSARLITSVYKGLKFYTEGVNGFVAAEDVAEILCKLAYSETKNERFILVAENLSYASLFAQMASVFGIKAPRILIKPTYVPWISWLFRINAVLNRNSNLSVETLKTSVKKFTYSNAKIKQLGFAFTPLSETIKKTCLAYAESRPYF